MEPKLYFRLIYTHEELCLRLVNPTNVDAIVYAVEMKRFGKEPVLWGGKQDFRLVAHYSLIGIEEEDAECYTIECAPVRYGELCVKANSYYDFLRIDFQKLRKQEDRFSIFDAFNAFMKEKRYTLTVCFGDKERKTFGTNEWKYVN